LFAAGFVARAPVDEHYKRLALERARDELLSGNAYLYEGLMKEIDRGEKERLLCEKKDAEAVETCRRVSLPSEVFRFDTLNEAKIKIGEDNLSRETTQHLSNLSTQSLVVQ
jgi:hypothetical protein